MIIPRPDTHEYPAYAQLYMSYTTHINDVLNSLEEEEKNLVKALSSIDDISFSYAQGKWTIAQSIVHLVDTERIFNFRALVFARGEQQEISGFDQDQYVENIERDFDLKSLLEYFTITRAATISLFNSFDPSILTNEGMASGNPLSVRAAAYFILGHQLHHHHVLRTKYGVDI